MKQSRALLLAVLFMAAAPSFSQTARLSRTSLGPADPPEALLSLSERARVSVAVKSSTGMAISLHDRMEGEIANEGSNGISDGRIDLSLEAGEYKVRLEGKDASGAAVGLAATVWKELNGDKPATWPKPADNQVLSASLDDLETWSCWVRGGPGRPLEVEGLGRCLSSLEIWKDGQYLLQTIFPQEEFSIVEGKPMGWIGSSLEVEEGWYWLRFNGGKRRVWTKEDGKAPFHFRSGFTRLPSGGRLDLKVSPFGREWILVGRSSTAVVSRADGGAAWMASLPWATGKGRLERWDSASLGGTAKPWAKISLDAYSPWTLLRVQAEPGAALSLDCFTEVGPGTREFSQTGILTLLRSRTGEVDFPLTGLIFRTVYEGAARTPKAVIEADFSLPLGSKDQLRLSANFDRPGERRLIVKVAEAGSYRVAEDPASKGKGCFYRIQSLGPALEGSRRGESLEAAKAVFSLTPGYHELRVESGRSLGPVEIVVFKDGLFSNPKSLLAKPAPAPRLTWNWDRELKGGANLLLSQWGDSPAGIVYHDAPLKAGMGASYEFLPGESFSLSLSLDGPGILSWDSGGLSAKISGQALAASTRLPKGAHRLLLSNPGKAPASAALSLEPDGGSFREPAIQALGQGLESLAPGKTVWRDFSRNETWTAAFTVTEPSVYVLESLGRLSTSLVVRSPLRDDLFRAAGNGYGRNASLRAFLRPGPYLLRISTQGMSTGRAGVSLRKVPIQEAPVLEDGSVDRRLLPADTALLARLRIASGSQAELVSTSLGRPAQIRLEDREFFPVYSGSGRFQSSLAKGEYLLYSLPESLETRRLTTLRLFPAPSEWKGEAVNRPLPLNAPQRAVWSGKSAADTWLIEAPADILVNIYVDSGMSAALEGPGLSGPAPEGAFELKRGRHLLSVKAREENSGYAYGLSLITADLAPGLPQRAAPSYREGARMAVSVPEDGLYELWSMGQNDVAAELRRAGSGELVARSDDRGADWNVDIVHRLQAGRYELLLRSLAGEGREAEFRLDAMKPRALGATSGSFKQKIDLDKGGILLPFKSGKAEALYLIEADSDAEVNLRLYRDGKLLASGTGEMALPLKASSSYELYAWTAYPAEAQFSLFPLAEKAASMGQLAVLAAGAWRLGNAEGLSARFVSGRALVSSGMELPCADVGSSPFSTLSGGGWAWIPSGEAALEALRLDPGSSAILSFDGVGQGFRTGDAASAILLESSGGGDPSGGIFIAPTSGSGPAPVNWDSSASAGRGRLALLPPGQWKARMLESVDGANAEILRVSLSASSYPVDRLDALPRGARAGFRVEPGKALSFAIPASAVELILDEGLILSAWKDGKALATRASAADMLSSSLALPACTVLIANRGSRSASARLILKDAPSAAAVLKAAAPFEALDIPSGGMEIGIAPASGEALWIASDRPATALVLGDDGTSLRLESEGSGIPRPSATVPPKGRLVLHSEGGLLRVWLAKPNADPLKGLFDKAPPKASRTLKESLPLAGKPEAFHIVMEADGYADIACPGPGVLSLSGKGTEPLALLSGSREDMHLFAWLPAGDYELLHRPAAESSSGGALKLAKVAVQAVDEATAAEPRLIAAGEYQAFSFELAQAGRIGVGIRGLSDGLAARLYDARQGLLASGPLMFPSLEKGRYLLVVRGLDRGAMEYSLILLGLDGSRQGVPQELSDSYKEESGSSRSELVPMRQFSGGYSSQGSGGYSDGPYGDDYYGDDYYGDDPSGGYYEEGYYGDDYGY